MQNITISEVVFGSDTYQETLSFREKILRLPLGLTLSDADTAGEDQQMHIAAFANDVVVGTVVLKFFDDHARVRQMAVDTSLQRSGIGKKLMQHAENIARVKGYKKIILHARMSAFHFYQSLGYNPEGEEYIEVTVPTIDMVKQL